MAWPVNNNTCSKPHSSRVKAGLVNKVRDREVNGARISNRMEILIILST